MNIVVQKFGGSSLFDKRTMLIVCKHIIKEYNLNNGIVVVVSAQGNMTNKLIEEGLEIDTNASKREMDMLISTGEQMSAAKLVICLNLLGYKAISFTSWQIPIITNHIYGNVNIKKINNKKIKKALKGNNIVVVTGFQGIDEKNNITTLGRGGSDTTAIALAIKLKAKKVEFYKDVDGIYSEDPHININAKRYETISYEDMLKLSNSGAKVLQKESIEMGMKYHIPIIVKSTFEENSIGTIIS